MTNQQQQEQLQQLQDTFDKAINGNINELGIEKTIDFYVEWAGIANKFYI